MNISIFDFVAIKPFQAFGLQTPFWTVHIDTLVYTWIAMAIIMILSLVGRRAIMKGYGVSLIALAYERVVTFFLDLCTESFGQKNYEYFYFVISLFLFTFTCCAISVIPYLDESTKDLNTTLALAIISFCYVQYQKIKALGIRGFCKEFVDPTFLLAPIHIVGEFAKIASMSFRLFGNILGGGIIFSMVIQVIDSMNVVFLAMFVLFALSKVLAHFIPKFAENRIISTFTNRLSFVLFLVVWLQMFFGIFEGLIQSFVLTMLTITYLATGIAGHGDDHEDKKEVVS